MGHGTGKAEMSRDGRTTKETHFVPLNLPQPQVRPKLLRHIELIVLVYLGCFCYFFSCVLPQQVHMKSLMASCGDLDQLI